MGALPLEIMIAEVYLPKTGIRGEDCKIFLKLACSRFIIFFFLKKYAKKVKNPVRNTNKYSDDVFVTLLFSIMLKILSIHLTQELPRVLPTIHK